MRISEHVSQGVMARYLNVSPSTYQKWERGEVIPSGGNLKLLNLAYRNGLECIA
jgi:putative transcriptional regulator